MIDSYVDSYFPEFAAFRDVAEMEDLDRFPSLLTANAGPRGCVLYI